MRHLIEVLVEIDEANSADPTMFGQLPLALVQGQLASRWLDRLSHRSSLELQIAARAHHLRRWEIKRIDYPEGRAGYLRWRRENKAHQAASVAEILEPAGFDAATIERVQDLLRRRGLGTDPETQTLEDVACLVFVETQFEEMASRLEYDRMVNVVAKTLNKMSPEAIDLAAALSLPEGCCRILEAAVAAISVDA